MRISFLLLRWLLPGELCDVPSTNLPLTTHTHTPEFWRQRPKMGWTFYVKLMDPSDTWMSCSGSCATQAPQDWTCELPPALGDLAADFLPLYHFLLFSFEKGLTLRISPCLMQWQKGLDSLTSFQDNLNNHIRSKRVLSCNHMFDLFLCFLVASSFAYKWCYWDHDPKHLLHDDLHLRICFSRSLGPWPVIVAMEGSLYANYFAHVSSFSAHWKIILFLYVRWER